MTAHNSLPANQVDAHTLAYRELKPEQILSAVESLGMDCDGRLLALNSYENRVYRVGIEERAPVVAKFYRPHRWSDAAINEEHEFTRELAEQEIPVAAPLPGPEGQTLHWYRQFRFAIYPCYGGRAPELDDSAHLEQLGRYLARLHNVAAQKTFVHRPTLSVKEFGEDACHFLLEHDFIPSDLQVAYRTLAEDLLIRIRRRCAETESVEAIRLHGDLHAGNVLWTESGALILDLDDARNGPVVQDLWMLLSGEREYQTARLADLLSGYEQFRRFDPLELLQVEALRTLRLMHYYAWLARRWKDPAFPQAFPWFNSHRCWEEHILTLREQAAALDEPPLEWRG